MCRIAVIRGYNREKDTELLTKLFTHLESSNGGSGNGIGGWVKGKPVIKKGVKLTVAEIVKIAIDTKWDNETFMFHTRIPSKGPATDDNCHPFTYGDSISCHNGTTTTVLHNYAPILIDLIKKRGDNITDSECVAYLIGKYGFEVLFNRTLGVDFSGVFVSLFKDGSIMSYKSYESKDLDIFTGKDNFSIVVTSEFPKDYYTVDNDIKVIPGGPLDIDMLLVKEVWAKLKEGKAPYVYPASTHYDNWKDRGGRKNFPLLPAPKVSGPSATENTTEETMDAGIETDNRNFDLVNDVYLEKTGSTEEPDPQDIEILKNLQAILPDLRKVVDNVVSKNAIITGV